MSDLQVLYASIQREERRMLLFLGLDGVLRPIGSSGSLQHLDWIARLLVAYPRLDIVISDRMRERLSLAEIKSMLPASIEARIIAVTRVFQFERGAGTQEVTNFVNNFADRCSSFVCIDFDRVRFNNHVFRRRHMAFTDPQVGLQRIDEIRLRSLLTRAIYYDPRDSVRAYKLASLKDRQLFVDGQQKTTWTWAPKVVMMIPRTLQLEYAVQSGGLARYLFRGTDRIYVHEMALIRRPSLLQPIAALHNQFPDRLRVVPMDSFDFELFAIYADDSGIEQAELLLFGHALKNEFLQDMEKQGMPEPQFVLSLGQSSQRAITHGWPVDLQTWGRMDAEGVAKLNLEQATYWKRKDRETEEVMAETFKNPTIAITTIPDTDVVVDIVQSGLLEQRLKLGLEHIFVSTFSIRRRPELDLPLRRLAKRYKRNFSLVQMPLFTDEEMLLIYPDDTQAAGEYMIVAANLAGAYRTHYGCGNQKPYVYPDDMPAYRFRLGPLPSIPFLIGRECPVAVDEWRELDGSGMAEILAAEVQRKEKHVVESVAALSATIDRNQGRP